MLPYFLKLRVCWRGYPTFSLIFQGKFLDFLLFTRNLQKHTFAQGVTLLLLRKGLVNFQCRSKGYPTFAPEESIEGLPYFPELGKGSRGYPTFAVYLREGLPYLTPPKGLVNFGESEGVTLPLRREQQVFPPHPTRTRPGTFPKGRVGVC